MIWAALRMRINHPTILGGLARLAQEMQGPRIIFAERSGLRLLAESRRIRYGIVLVVIAVPFLLALYLGPTIDRDLHLTVLFSAILAASVIGGLGPGLLATIAGTIIGSYVPPSVLTGPDIKLLATEGILVSAVGGAFRTARRRAWDRLRANLRLEQEILEIGDDERRRIGHDLHDGLGQHLTGISLLGETLAQQVQAGHPPDRGNIDAITRLASEAVSITRDLAKSVSPVTLERDGFVAAIEELAETTSGLLGINCTWEIPDEDLKLDRSRSLHLYRIIQEAVNNSVRHGKAKHVRIEAQREGDVVNVTVSDDGSGLSEKTMNEPGLGLRIMQYRCRMLRASLSVERMNPAGGTIVTCACPLNGHSPAQPE